MTRSDRRTFLDLLLDVRECNSDDVTKRIAQQFPDNLILERTPFSANEAHAFSYVIKHVTKRLEFADLRYCDLTTQVFRLITNGLNASESQVSQEILFQRNLNHQRAPKLKLPNSKSIVRISFRHICAFAYMCFILEKLTLSGSALCFPFWPILFLLYICNAFSNEQYTCFQCRMLELSRESVYE